jgi:hypothetical protein
MFDAPGLTQSPPGPYLSTLARKHARTIRVSSPKFDNIGEVLNSMAVEFEQFTGDYDCDLLFINCGTSDRLDPQALHEFVRQGGCLYASDLTSSLMESVAPGLFHFNGSGAAGLVDATIVDPELREVLGEHTKITFDMGGWAMLDRCQGEILVAAAPGSPYAGKPLMVGVELGEGAIFYTSFHNRAQVSGQERALLQLLVLKQIGSFMNTSLTQASKSVGVNLQDLKLLAKG